MHRSTLKHLMIWTIFTLSACSDDNNSPTPKDMDTQTDMSADTSGDMATDMFTDASVDQDSSMDMSNKPLCNLNERVVAGACEACPAGSTNDPGDDPNQSMDTTCAPTLCPQDHAVQNHTCVACPAGSTNAPGDDATGANTSCEDSCSIVFGVPCDAIKTQYIKSSNSEGDDVFGGNVAISGDTLVVAATGESSNATGINGNQSDNTAAKSGAVYVFVRQNGTWTQQAYLKASNTDLDDHFGYSVAISGDIITVGAPFESSGDVNDPSDNSAPYSGAAYVFVRQNGIWSQQAYLKASNIRNNSYFGWSLALSGETLVVGAINESSGSTGVNGDQTNFDARSSGAAYVFVRQNGTWSQQAYLKASNTDKDDKFGSAVSISNDTIVVGTQYEASNATGINGDQSDNSKQQSGAAYVFVRQNGTWSQQAYLKASNTDSFDSFGIHVAINDDTIVVGAHGEDSNATGINGDQSDNAKQQSGAAYVFVRENGIWSQQAYIKASNPDANDGFGYQVAVVDGVIAIGAFGESSNATGINGDTSDNTTPRSGALYLFVKKDNAWRQQAYIKSPNTKPAEQFGAPFALGTQILVGGAYRDASNAKGINGDPTDTSSPNSGAVYTFEP